MSAYRITEQQRAHLVAGLAQQTKEGPHALRGGHWRNLEAKGLASSQLDGHRQLYTLTPAGVELATQLRRARTAPDLADPRGPPTRTGLKAERVLKSRLDPDEWAHLEAWTTRHKRSFSETVRAGLAAIGALPHA